MKPIPTDAVARRRLIVRDDMTVDFEQDDPRLGALHPVYATYWLVKHVELVGRALTLPYLEPGEEGIGVGVDVRHLAPALPGMALELEAALAGVAALTGGGWRVRAACRVTNELGDVVGEGTMTQLVLPRARLEARFEELRRRWSAHRAADPD